MTTYKEILKGIDSIAFPKRINKSAIAIIKKFCRYTLSVLLNATYEFYVSMCTYYHYLITTIWLLVYTEKLLIREIRIKSHNIYLFFQRCSIWSSGIWKNWIQRYSETTMVQWFQLGRIKKWHHETPNHPRGELGVTMNCSLITARQRSCGKVMFSQVSVCHSVRGGL